MKKKERRPRKKENIKGATYEKIELKVKERTGSIYFDPFIFNKKD